MTATADGLSLDGKVAVVTGGTSGIGREICLRFARAGAQVVAAGRRADAGAEVVDEIESAGGNARFLETDVTDPDQVARLIGSAEEAYGHVNILVSAAGVMLLGSAPETSVDVWCTTVETNLSGPFNLAKHGIPALLRAGGGTMVVISSELGLVGAREAAAYCAAKGGTGQHGAGTRRRPRAAGCPRQLPLPWADPLCCRDGSMPGRTRRLASASRSSRCHSRGWVGSTRSPRPHSSWPRTPAPTSRGRSWSPMEERPPGTASRSPSSGGG